MKKNLDYFTIKKLNPFSFGSQNCIRLILVLILLVFTTTNAIFAQLVTNSSTVSGTTTITYTGTSFTTVSMTGASNSGTTITVTSTTGLQVGAVLFVTAGTGSFPVNDTVVSININGTQFVASAAPTTALSTATISAASPIAAGATTWTPPTGVNVIQVEAWGAGGGGAGSPTNSTRVSGGGGAGGSYVKQTNFSVSGNYVVNVGNGGLGGATTNSVTNTVNGYNGGVSYLMPVGNTSTTNLVAALGGAGGVGGVTGTPAVGGSGGVNGTTGVISTYSGVIYSITNGGSSYTSAPTVLIGGASPNSGFGNGSIRTLSSGTAYTVGQILYAGNNVYKVTVAGNATTSTLPTNAFGDYAIGATFTYVGVRATATAIVTNGVVTGLIVKDGSGYTTAPSVVFSGGGGSGAAATAIVLNSNYPTTGATSFTGGNGGNGYIHPTTPGNNRSGGGGSSAGTASNGNNGGGNGSGGTGSFGGATIGPVAGVGVTGGGGNGATGVGTTTSGTYSVLSSTQFSGGGSGGVGNVVGEAGGGGAAGKLIITYTLPTLSGAVQAATVAPGNTATINLTGLVASSTANKIDYTINGVAQTQVTGIDADASGNASFTTTSLSGANNGQTLQVTKITNSATNFTAFTQNVTLSVVSSVVANTWLGGSNSFNTPSNWDLNRIPITTDSLIIPVTGNNPVVDASFSVHSVTVSPGAAIAVSTGNTLTVANGILLQSNASGTASIANSDGTIIANVTVERYIPSNNRKRYVLVSSPVSSTLNAGWQEGGAIIAGYGTHITQAGGANTNGYDGNATSGASLFTYNDDNASGSKWVASSTATTTASSLAPGKGYLLFVRGDRAENRPATGNSSNTTLRATGVIGAGTVNLTLNTGVSKYTLIANPYPSAIDWNSVSITKNHLTNNFTVYDPNNAVFVSSNGTVKTPSVGNQQAGYIQSGQAFFVQNDETGNGTIAFTEAAKTTAAATDKDNTVFGVDNGKSQLNINIYHTSDKSFADGVVALFGSNYTTIVDSKEDITKFTNLNETFGLKRNGMVLGLEARPIVATNDTLFFSLSNFAKKSYNLVIDGSNFEPTTTAKLEDKFTGTTTALALDSSTNYSFIVTDDVASSSNDRFKIIFGNTPASTVIADGAAASLYVKMSPNPVTNQLQVSFKTATAEATSIKIVNNLGQVVKIVNAGKISTGNVLIPVSELASGVYSVQLLSADKVIRTQQVVKQQY